MGEVGDPGLVFHSVLSLFDGDGNLVSGKF